jgi:hypothetical protein
MCLVSSAAWAQVPPPPPTAPPAVQTDEPKTERATNVMFGYQFMHDNSWSENMYLGAGVTLSHRISKSISLVGEASGSHGFYGTTGFTIQRYAFMGGAKVTGGEGNVRPFFQVLAGWSRQGGDVGELNGAVLQPGGGADFFLTERWTLRAQGDFRVIYEETELRTAYRIMGGIVFYLGKKK